MSADRRTDATRLIAVRGVGAALMLAILAGFGTLIIRDPGTLPFAIVVCLGAWVIVGIGESIATDRILQKL
ncbi:MAG: hypothetical protein PHR28_10925 [candidate division Zixibacteria bacterium]|nr:hypothetical protein [candidate division Zixibacteria bacterium]